MKQYIETGRITSTHGVRGEVKITPWSDSPDTVAALSTLYFADGTALTVERMRVAGSMVLCKFKGVDTMDAANAMRGKTVFLDRGDTHLEQGQYFICDLIGLRVVDSETGEEYGKLSDVSQTGANDVYHIRRPDGKEVLIPAIGQVVVRTDPEKGEMAIRPMKGMFDDAD